MSSMHRRTKTEHSTSKNGEDEREKTHDKIQMVSEGILVEVEEKSQESAQIEKIFYTIPRQPRRRT